MGICFIAHTHIFHLSLSQACSHRCHHDLYCGTSINRSPSTLFLNISKTVFLMVRSFPSRRMCPSQVSLCARIHLTMSKLCHFGDSSWCGGLSDITLIICVLAPLRFLTVSVLISHASYPYTKILHTLDLYKSSLRLYWRALSFHRCLIFPNLVWTLAILVCMSLSCPPSACMIEPRYLKCHTLSADWSPHFVFDSCCCIWLRFSSVTSWKAVCVTLVWFLRDVLSAFYALWGLGP